MKLSYVYLRPSHLIGFRAVGPYPQAAPQAWQEMFDWLDANCLRGTVKRGFGMAFDDPRHTPADKCRYQACIDLPETMAPTAYEHLMPQRLPGGAYARWRHVGNHERISEVIHEIRETWCDRAGVVLAKGRPLIEIYLDDPKFCAAEKLRTDICVPVAFAEERGVA